MRETEKEGEREEQIEGRKERGREEERGGRRKKGWGDREVAWMKTALQHAREGADVLDVAEQVLQLLHNMSCLYV